MFRDLRRLTRFLLNTAHLVVRALLADGPVDAMASLEPAPPELQARLDTLADAGECGAVDLFLYESDVANAIPIATDDGAVVVLTTGLLDRLGEDALMGVLAHELAHIELRHGRRFGAVLLVTGVVGLAIERLVARSHWTFRAAAVAILAGGSVVGLPAVSRSYVRAADALAIDRLGDPDPLAKAIIAMRTGRSDVDPATYDPPAPSLRSRVLGLYPPHRARMDRIRSAGD